jgi:large subunit ribosomal protein L13
MKINAENLIVGMVASVAAKKALLGEQVEIVNCGQAVMSGKKTVTFQSYVRKQKMGTHRKGPFYFREPDRFVKRVIRGMLPHRQEKGRQALKRIRCFQGIPDSAKKEDYKTIESAHFTKLKSTRYVYVKDVCRIMGGK